MAPNRVDRVQKSMPSTDEAELIRRLQCGELDALGTLFEAYQHLVYRTALGITRDRRAAEDIQQECFVRLYTYAASIDTARPLRPWLYRVTVNLAYDWATMRRCQPLDDMLNWISGLAAAFPAPDRRVEEKERLQMVHEVIAELSPRHRAVIVLFYLEDLPLHEISQVLDVPVGTVKSRLHYARARLRDSLSRRQRVVPEMAYEFT